MPNIFVNMYWSCVFVLGQSSEERNSEDREMYSNTEACVEGGSNGLDMERDEL